MCEHIHRGRGRYRYRNRAFFIENSRKWTEAAATKTDPDTDSDPDPDFRKRRTDEWKRVERVATYSLFSNFQTMGVHDSFSGAPNYR